MMKSFIHVVAVVLSSHRQALKVEVIENILDVLW